MPNEIDAVQITDNLIRKWVKSIKTQMSFKFFDTYLKNEKT